MTNKPQKQFESNLANQAKENPKAIWKFISSKQKTKESIGESLTDQNHPASDTTSNNKEKVNIIADFFTNVFTIKPEADDEEVSTISTSNF